MQNGCRTHLALHKRWLLRTKLTFAEIKLLKLQVWTPANFFFSARETMFCTK